MIFNQGDGVVGGEDPVVERSLAPAREGRKLGGRKARRGREGIGRRRSGGEAGLGRGGLEERQRGGVEEFARRRVCTRRRRGGRVGAGEFGGAEFAGGEIEGGEAEGGNRTAAVTATAQRKLFSSEPSCESAAVPGVTTRVTSRRTSFLVSLGSSTWSQMATLYPLRMSLEM